MDDAGRARADRRNGALRWGTEETNLIRAYIQADPPRIDVTRVGSAAYMRDLHEMEELWARHPQKNFNQNVRRQVQIYLASRDQEGARARNASESLCYFCYHSCLTLTNCLSPFLRSSITSSSTTSRRCSSSKPSLSCIAARSTRRTP